MKRERLGGSRTEQAGSCDHGSAEVAISEMVSLGCPEAGPVATGLHVPDNDGLYWYRETGSDDVSLIEGSFDEPKLLLGPRDPGTGAWVCSVCLFRVPRPSELDDALTAFAADPRSPR